MTKQKPTTTHSVTVQGATYHIRRRGSRYNILGPKGRAFKTYQSAALVGPRWEELTGTPWPHPSSAYAPGMHLGELQPEVTPAAPPTEPQPVPARRTNRSHPVTRTARPAPMPFVLAVLPMALPAPRIDLGEQMRLMQLLRQNPPLLFHPQMRQALQHEVEYHRPQARWAQHLLKLLARYDTHQHRAKPPSSATVLAKHIAWQEQRLRAVAHSG
jgi:hypothetical protein